MRIGMARSVSAPALASGALSCFLLLFGGLPVEAQSDPGPMSRTQFGIGYIANAPEAMAGGSGYVILPRWGGIGVFVDAKFDISNPTGERGFDPSVTASRIRDQVGGEFIKGEDSWWSANVGVLRPLTPFLMVYGGGGFARKTLFELYDVDVNSGVGEGGVVWAEDPGAQETRANLMVGIIMRLTGRVSTHLGLETQPRGLTVGASLRIPRW